MNLNSAINVLVECAANMEKATNIRESTIRELQRTIEDRNSTIYAAKRVNDTLSSENASKDDVIKELKSNRSDDKISFCSNMIESLKECIANRDRELDGLRNMLTNSDTTIKELQNRNDTQAVDISKLNAYINKHTKPEKASCRITLRNVHRNSKYRGIIVLHIRSVFDVDYDDAILIYNGLIQGDTYIGLYNAHLVDSDLLDCQAFSLPT